MYRAPVPASSSSMSTEPDSIWLPEFDVVAVNAAEVTKTASPAISATTAKVRKSLRFLLSVCWLLFIWFLLAQMCPGFCRFGGPTFLPLMGSCRPFSHRIEVGGRMYEYGQARAPRRHGPAVLPPGRFGPGGPLRGTQPAGGRMGGLDRLRLAWRARGGVPRGGLLLRSGGPPARLLGVGLGTGPAEGRPALPALLRGPGGGPGPGSRERGRRGLRAPGGDLGAPARPGGRGRCRRPAPAPPDPDQRGRGALLPRCPPCGAPARHGAVD